MKKKAPGIWNIPLLLIITICSRLVASYLFHIHYDSSHVDIGMQLIDPALLRTRMLESIWYLHSQPPLFNLFTGLVLKVFPVNYPLAFSLLFKLFGLFQITLFYWSLLQLTGRSRVAFYTTLFFAVSPAFLLYESWFFYTFPAMCLLSASVSLLIKFLQTRKTSWAFLFFLSLSFLCLSVSIFHLVWLLLVVILLALLKRSLTRQIILASALPVLLVLAWYFRSLVLFGQFSCSSWMGISLAHILLAKPQQIAAIENDSTLAIARIKAFEPIETYTPWLPAETSYPGIPVLQEKNKLEGGDHNFNNIGYIYVSDKYKKAAMRSLKKKPLLYLDMVGVAYILYFAPASEYFFLRDNKSHILWYDRLFTVGGFKVERYMGLANFLLMFIYLIVFYRTGRRLIRHYQSNRLNGLSWSLEDIVVLFASFNVIFLMLTGNFLEVGENMRFRFYVIPLFLIMVVWCLLPDKKQARNPNPFPGTF